MGGVATIRCGCVALLERLSLPRLIAFGYGVVAVLCHTPIRNRHELHPLNSIYAMLVPSMCIPREPSTASQVPPSSGILYTCSMYMSLCSGSEEAIDRPPKYPAISV